MLRLRRHAMTSLVTLGLGYFKFFFDEAYNGIQGCVRDNGTNGSKAARRGYVYCG